MEESLIITDWKRMDPSTEDTARSAGLAAGAWSLVIVQSLVEQMTWSVMLVPTYTVIPPGLMNVR